MELELSNITKCFGSNYALKNVSANFTGKVNLILGANGSGKTTLINVICGLTYPESGTLIIDGTEINATNSADWRKAVEGLQKKLGIFSDSLGFPSSYDGIELLDSTVKSSGGSIDRKWQEHLIQELDMSSFVGRQLSSYSTGMTKKLGIASSLVIKPELVLWDEPTASLDAGSRDQVLRLMDEMIRLGSIFLIASHVPAEFERLADWLGLMSLGQIVKSGKLSELEEGSGEYVALTDDPKGLATALIQKGISSNVRIVKEKLHFTALEQDCLKAPELLAKETGIQVNSLAKVPKSAHELYLELLGVPG